ncbi:uncharacterized protein LOC127871585 [Dreissena polymorpha]|uniref:Uncharacterized protein n=1 Tax=Dreissena polymorpha TaxID=45954 RepID=A0A9D4LI09_DREPO|nr:uncharacterized protein LOC127871585 [Dreissena polymorpha]KAH3858214.1 hypothetical protein DPMN_100833 [Dreissena polymorpha]
MDLKPSHIFYSQDSINNFFGKRPSHNRTKNGETLDNICEGRCHVSSIPTITVVKRDRKWVTADNRRLWVFHQFERLEKCDTILVRISTYIPAAKLTSNNGLTSVRVCGPAGGYWHNKPKQQEYPVQSTMQITNQASVHLSGYKVNESIASQTLFASNAPSEYKATKLKPQYDIHMNYSPPTCFGYSSVPTRMTSAPKSIVDHPSLLTKCSTSESFQTNPIRSGLHSTYKAKVPATPIRYSLSKYPTFSDISKAQNDHSHRYTRTSVSQNSDQRSYSKQGGLSVSQDLDQHDNYSKQGACSVSQYRNHLSACTKQGNSSISTVKDSSVYHSFVRATEPNPYASEPHYILPTSRHYPFTTENDYD